MCATVHLVDAILVGIRTNITRLHRQLRFYGRHDDHPHVWRQGRRRNETRTRPCQKKHQGDGGRDLHGFAPGAQWSEGEHIEPRISELSERWIYRSD